MAGWFEGQARLQGPSLIVLMTSFRLLVIWG